VVRSLGLDSRSTFVNFCFTMLMINITMLMITFVDSTISKSTSPGNYSFLDSDAIAVSQCEGCILRRPYLKDFFLINNHMKYKEQNKHQRRQKESKKEN